jgi:hypothetical protein
MDIYLYKGANSLDKNNYTIVFFTLGAITLVTKARKKITSTPIFEKG